MSPDRVSAVIVTKGNVDLRPVLDSLIFDDVVVYDNSREPDRMTYGRVLALDRCRHDVIFSIDDDITHTTDNQLRIVDHYQPGVLTGCMWPEWSDGARQQGIEHGYDDLVFPGSGAVYDRDLPGRAVDRYLEHFPLDEFFLLWCDTIVGVLAANKQLDIRFDALPWAEADDRMCNLPHAAENKRDAIRRARWVRDHGWPKRDAHEVYLDEMRERLEREAKVHA